MRMQVLGKRILVRRIKDTGFERMDDFYDRPVSAEIVGIGNRVSEPEHDMETRRELIQPCVEVGDKVILFIGIGQKPPKVGEQWFTFPGYVAAKLVDGEER